MTFDEWWKKELPDDRHREILHDLALRVWSASRREALEEAAVFAEHQDRFTHNHLTIAAGIRALKDKEAER